MSCPAVGGFPETGVTCLQVSRGGGAQLPSCNLRLRLSPLVLDCGFVLKATGTFSQAQPMTEHSACTANQQELRARLCRFSLGTRASTEARVYFVRGWMKLVQFSSGKKDGPCSAWSRLQSLSPPGTRPHVVSRTGPRGSAGISYNAVLKEEESKSALQFLLLPLQI